MKRVEVILSQAIDEDFITFCDDRGIGKRFTKIPTAMGKGCSSPKMGDSVWPQFNTIYIFYCNKAEAEIVYGIVEILQREHPEEGIACFVSKASCGVTAKETEESKVKNKGKKKKTEAGEK